MPVVVPKDVYYCSLNAILYNKLHDTSPKFYVDGEPTNKHCRSGRDARETKSDAMESENVNDPWTPALYSSQRHG